MFSLKARTLALAVLSTLSIQILSPIVLNTYADNTTYYVDATAGSDANDGLSLGTPWQSLTHVSSQTFLPGDQILLKCGETWTDTLMLDDIGVSGNEITVSSYGVGCSSSSVVTLAGTGAEQIHIASGASDIIISNIHFSNGTGITLDTTNNIQIIQNNFTNTLGVGINSSGAINSTIQENYFEMVAGMIGIMSNTDVLTNIVTNTFSGGVNSINITNSSDININSNTLYLPSSSAIIIVEDASVPAGTVQNNIIGGNTILTWNTTVPMIHIDDQNDDIGTLASVIGNTYINTYKYQTSIVDILANGTGTLTYDKNTITDIDPLANTFNHFGYSGYTGDETRLLVNTGSSPADIACPPLTVCGQMVSTTNSGVTFPVNVPAYESRITLWNNSPNTLRVPACTLNPAPATVANGDPVTLTWTVTNGTGTTMTEPTASGGTLTNPIVNNGSGTYYPPLDDQVNHYELTTENAIGTNVCSADVTAQNNPPVQSVFFATGSEDAVSITGALEATDSSGDTVYFGLYTDSINGTTSINTFNGNVTYTPNADFCGTDTFAWEAYDQFNRYSDPAFGTITVLCDNDAPVAFDDTLGATGGQLAILDVTLNDTDPDTPYEAQTYTVSGITLPAEGTLVASGAVFEYTPNFVFMGTDSFTYVTIDQSGAVSNTGTVTINVAPGMNLAPTVSSGIYMFDEDTSIPGVFSGSDLNGDTLSFSAVTLPANGVLTIMGSGFSYVPNANFNGSDSFDFVANDGFLDSNMATMTLNVNPVMDVPVAVDDTMNVEMDTMSSLDVIANDTDGDNPYQPQTLTLTGISTPANGTASIVGNEIQYTPNTLYLGPDSIEYTIEDQDGNLSNTGIVSITVSTTNQYPVADSGSFILTEDVPLTQTLSGSDPDLTPVTFVLDTDVTNGTLTLSSTGEFIYTPDADYNGTDSFTFHVTDGIFDSNPIQTVTLTITAQNDNPLAVADAFSVSEDSYLDTTVLINDSDADVGDTFVINSVTSPLNGTAVMTGNLITYTPNSNYCGMDTFEYTTIDLSGATSNVGSVTMTIDCMNDIPTANDVSYTTTGNVITSTGNILMGSLSGADIDVGDILTYTVIQNVLSGTLILTGSTFSYEGDIDFIGTDSFTYTATDLSGALSNTGTVTINVVANNFNAVPVAYSGTFTMNEDSVLSDVLSGSDLEGGILTYIMNTDVSNGALSISATGAFTYTPATNYYGTDSFTFLVYDGEFSSDSVMVSINITSVNDAPIAISDTATGTEDTQIIINPITNDTDIDIDTLSLNIYTQGANGTVTSSGNTITYFPNLNYCGSDSVDYTTMDSGLAISNTGTINITVTCINDAPIATGETISATEDTPILIPVLANDTDVELSTLSVANLTQPGSGGTVAISGTGVMFTPTANFCTANPATFTYQARDTASALSAITTVTISSITCVNDTPTSTSTSYSMTGNVVINPGTMLSGGTLTGYVATTNTLVRNLTSVDIDGDTVTFSGITFPTHGTGTLSATGLLTYIPTPSYIGNDSMSFSVTDGTGTSTPYTITLVVQNPNPPVVTAPASGPGGGGGGSSPSYALVSGAYKSATSAGTSTGLTSQLLLTSGRIKQPSSSGVVIGSYDSFILPIIQVIEEAKVDPESSKERATAIRQSGQKLMYSLTRSIVLTAVEKAQAIKSAEAELSSMSDSVEPSRESRALDFIIRVMKRERAKIEKSLNTVTYLMTL